MPARCPSRERVATVVRLMAELPSTLVRMVGELSRIGLSELHRRLKGDLTPARSPGRDRLAELGALAAILAAHGSDVARIAPAAHLPEIQERVDRRARETRGPRRFIHPPDPATNYRAHNPRREDSELYDSFVPTPGGVRERRAEIREPLPIQRWRSVEPWRYDQLRPDSAPSAAQLTAHYGTWQRACRAADGLLPDGRYAGIGLPWVNLPAGRPRADRYTREDAVAAIRECALALLTHPSCHQYLLWARGRNAARDGRDQQRRLPSHAVIMRCFGGYRAALAAAAISDEELAAASAERAGLALGRLASSPRSRLAAISAEDCMRLGLDADTILRLGADGFGWLPLPDAIELTSALGGSLDWLAERTPAPGETPPSGAVLNAARVRELRDQSALSDCELRTRAGLPLGPWRRLLNGSFTPTLAQTAQIASALGAPIDQLLSRGEPVLDRSGETSTKGRA